MLHTQASNTAVHAPLASSEYREPSGQLRHVDSAMGPPGAMWVPAGHCMQMPLLFLPAQPGAHSAAAARAQSTGVHFQQMRMSSYCCKGTSTTLSDHGVWGEAHTDTQNTQRTACGALGAAERQDVALSTRITHNSRLPAALLWGELDTACLPAAVELAALWAEDG